MNAIDYESFYTAEYFSGKRSFFYRLTGGYRDLSAVFDGYAADVRRHATSGRLLDIGCAYGFLLRRFEGQFETWGVDVSAHAVDRARQVTPASRLAVHNVVQPLPFDDGRFDVVTLTDVLEHLPDARTVLREIARVCRPGAVLYVTTPNRNLIRRVLYRIPDRLEHHVNLLSYGELRNLLDEAGFDVIERFTSINALFTRRFRRGLGPEQTCIARKRA